MKHTYWISLAIALAVTAIGVIGITINPSSPFLMLMGFGIVIWAAVAADKTTRGNS